jgi:hypothetical protein
MIQYVSVNNRRTFPEWRQNDGGELALMPVAASTEWGGEGAHSSVLSPSGFYRGGVAQNHPVFLFDDDDDEGDDDLEEDDFDDAEDDFDDFDDDDDDFDDDEDDDFDDDDDEEDDYDYEEDADYDDFDE